MLLPWQVKKKNHLLRYCKTIDGFTPTHSVNEQSQGCSDWLMSENININMNIIWIKRRQKCHGLLNLKSNLTEDKKKFARFGLIGCTDFPCSSTSSVVGSLDLLIFKSFWVTILLDVTGQNLYIKFSRKLFPYPN